MTKTRDKRGRWRDASGHYTRPPGAMRQAMAIVAQRMLDCLPADSPLRALAERQARTGSAE